MELGDFCSHHYQFLREIMDKNKVKIADLFFCTKCLSYKEVAVMKARGQGY